jgi:hypothetical protein
VAQEQLTLPQDDRARYDADHSASAGSSDLGAQLAGTSIVTQVIRGSD